jgi:hypothetical protein
VYLLDSESEPPRLSHPVRPLLARHIMISTHRSPARLAAPCLLATLAVLAIILSPSPAALETPPHFSHCVASATYEPPLAAGAPRPRLAFLKLHKVGSTTAHDLFICNYLQPNLLKRCDLNARDNSLGSLAALTQRAAGCDAIIEHDEHNQEVFRRFGFHGWDTLLGPRYVKLVLLREPTERLLSRYFYNIDHHDNVPLATVGWTRSADGWSGDWNAFDLWANATKHLVEAQHYLTILQNGGPAEPCKADACGRERVGVAISTLRTFDVVGILEEFDKFWADVCMQLGLSPALWSTELTTWKVSQGRPHMRDAPLAIAQRVKTLVRFDSEIYRAALELNRARR